MKILITGARGFLGTNLKNAFEKGLFASHHAIGHEFEVFPEMGDIRVPRGINVDRIYHLAGTPSPTKYKVKPVDVIMSSVQGTYNILELAKKTGARVLFVSTVDTDRYYSPDKPRAAYVDGKKCAEDLCYAYSKDVDVRVVKLFSSYGEGMHADDGRVIPSFIRAALRNDPLIVYGDGSQIDSFCYVSDTIQALYLTMESTNPNKTIEIGNPFLDRHCGLISIKELAMAIVELCESKSQIIFVPRDDIDKERVPNIHYLTKTLGWYPMVGLREGLKKTIEYYRGVL
jgi:UDP-glucuronate decarboxylase